jgi:hypothetical protein
MLGKEDLENSLKATSQGEPSFLGCNPELVVTLTGQAPSSASSTSFY